VLLEPVMKVVITTPEEYLGNVTGDLSPPPGMIIDTEDRGMVKIIHAEVPLSEMFGYTTVLRRDHESTNDRLLDLHRIMLRVQNDLFDVGADLCVPATKGHDQALRVTQAQVDWLEHAIDRHNERLGELRSFVLPGGSELAARLHVARTTVRRAERHVAALIEHEPDATSRLAMIYLNRLSDLLFVLARVANDDGARDVLWVPGAHREDP
jgi:ATP:cob(I)alamin adenosyltransferase